MKKIFFVGLFILLPCITFAQSTYYQNLKGEILDSLTYEKNKSEQLEKIRTAVKSTKMEVIDKLTLLRQSEDSIIMEYKWHFTDNVKKTTAEIESKQELVGKPFPFELLGLEKEINIQKVKGKPTLINLWFVGCKPCVEEMPVLNTFKESYGDSINFIALSYSSDRAVEKFLEKYTFTFEHYTGVKKLSRKLNINGFPANILLDKDGNVVEILGGIPYVLDKETKEMKIGDGKELKEKLDELLASE